MKKKVWVACSITHATDEYKEGIADLKTKLSEPFSTYDFFLSGTSEEAFEYATAAVKECDFMVAECSYPSIGLGYEIGIAIESNKPLFVFVQNDAKVTRLLEGIKREGYSFSRYTHMDELYDLIVQKVSALET